MLFASVASEVSTRPGPVLDRVAAELASWTGLLVDNARHAVGHGELSPDPEARQLAYELSTMLTGADIAYLLRDDPGVLAAVRAAIESRLTRR
jgi:hypothetical protein